MHPYNNYHGESYDHLPVEYRAMATKGGTHDSLESKYINTYKKVSGSPLWQQKEISITTYDKETKHRRAGFSKGYCFFVIK